MAAFSPMTFPFCGLSCVCFLLPFSRGAWGGSISTTLEDQELLPTCPHWRMASQAGPETAGAEGSKFRLGLVWH